jgi:hypothetical protein
MELLEGQTLKQRIAQKRFKTEKLLENSIQIADALEGCMGRITSNCVPWSTLLVT